MKAPCLLILLPFLTARAETVDDLLRKARSAWDRTEHARAVELATRAVERDPRDVRPLLLRATFRTALGRHAEAVADYRRCVRLDPKNAGLHDQLGSALFLAGSFADSVAAFDSFLELRPGERNGHWRRGIALYYAGKYDEGRKQFEGYEKVDTNDVENAVWHFLCVARKEGVAKARTRLLKVGKDRRVPMTQVYDLFAGKLKPADVLAAAEGGEVPAAERRSRLFYAHLYLGLYYDVTGEKRKALAHLEQAAGKYRVGHYMAEVARVHRDLLRKEKKE